MLRDFLDFLYPTPGWVEVSYAPGDPKHGVYPHRWYQWPRQAAEVLEALEQLSERHGDVYVTVSSYRDRKRDARYAQPSDVIHLDDAPERDDYAAVVRTSAGSRQAYFRLDTRLPHEERGSLAKRAAKALGADDCYDVTRLVRPTVGRNTKPGKGDYPVTLEVWEPERRTTVEALQELCAVRISSSPDNFQTNSYCTADWQAVDHHLANIGNLTDMSGMPRRFTERMLSYKMLAGCESRACRRAGWPDSVSGSPRAPPRDCPRQSRRRSRATRGRCGFP